MIVIDLYLLSCLFFYFETLSHGNIAVSDFYPLPFDIHPLTFSTSVIFSCSSPFLGSGPVVPVR